MAVMRAITFASQVSDFALNLILALGLALAIDYTLLIVSRFRDELSGGAGRDEALVRTMATTGRTVLFSAITVALSMAAMALFPMYFLTSFAIAAVAVVAFTAIASLVVTPAAIVLLGERLDSLDARRFARRSSVSNGATKTTGCCRAPPRRVRSVTSCAPVLRSTP
jgi:putative drug exporter of the RND superfamily